ncbi:MAG: twin-arginine translocase TatA/TatE family subunit [Deltaproteobacteria bacterium]|nr:twin-arginine translocase TatA/TatE family subunit [Deltaproteobacteria bacterium]
MIALFPEPSELPLGLFGLGSGELLLILLAILIIFGPSNLPKLADAMGKAIRNFKKSSTTPTESEAEGEGRDASGEPKPPTRNP